MKNQGEFLSMPLAKQAKKQRELLNAQRDRDLCRKMADASLAMFEKLDSLPDYESKRAAAGMENSE